jgi:hypothetical protein
MKFLLPVGAAWIFYPRRRTFARNIGHSSNFSVPQQIFLFELSSGIDEREARQVVTPSNGQNVSDTLLQPC